MTLQNSPARSVIDVGSVIADTYTLEALIGRGGMGAVFLASHKRLPGKKVAIKMLHAELENEELLARFKREAEIASRLGHPNIVTVHDFNVLPDGTPYLVLELLEGESLAQRLRQGPIPVDQTMTIVRQIGSALAAAHREGIVHRDLKPQNIFLVPTEVQGKVVEIAKVLDFGISKIRGSQTVQTQESAMLGTPQYMSPEQATGQHGNVDERTDVFALGAIVYEMLAGRPAFSGASIPEVVFKVVYEQPVPLDQLAKVSPAVDAAIKGAMAKSLADRFPNVSAFVEALTGEPLSIIRNRSGATPIDKIDTTSPSSKERAKSADFDAFARTVGSGDHGASPISGVDATAAGQSLVRGSAPTIDSQNQPAALPIHATVATPPARRSHALLFGALIVGAAGAALAMYVVMRPPSNTAPTTPVAQVTITADATSAAKPLTTEGPGSAIAPAPTKAIAEARATQNETPVKEIEAPTTQNETSGKKIEAAKKIETPIKKTETLVKKAETLVKKTEAATGTAGPAAKTKPETEEAGGDETVGQKLKDAEGLVTSDPTRAEQLVNSVINGEGGSPFQKMHAHAIRGVIMCTKHNDAEGAMIDLRQISIQRFHRRVVNACKSVGLMGAGQ